MEEMMKQVVRSLVFVLFGIFFLLGGTRQSSYAAPPHQEPPGPVQIGEIEPFELEIGYLNEAGWTQVIHYPNAAYIKIHFLKMNLRPGDYVTVSDITGNQVHTYPNPVKNFTTDEGEGFWALAIFGDTALVDLHLGSNPEPSINEDDTALELLGVEIDKFARGYSPEEIGPLMEGLQPESTCGTNQRTDVACYQATYPTEFGRANAVARLLINGIGLCTGWRVGPNNHMFTNEHCITNQAGVNGTEAWFNYQRPSCGTGTPGPVTQVTGNTFLIDDYTLDFALFTVNNFAAISSFGFLELDVRTPILDEQIYIPQHGAGNPKEFGINSDLNAGNLCRIDDAITIGRGIDTDTGYFCDTTGGSSGSPVLARSSHKVIGLHHYRASGFSDNCTAPGTNLNRGVRIDQIWPLVQPFLGGGPTGGNILINELDGRSSDAVELYNADTQAVTMTGWSLKIYNNGSLNVNYPFPTFTLQPGNYVVVHENSGANTATDLYIGSNIVWDPFWSGGAAALLDNGGNGIDFVRYLGSVISPPTGTNWSGTNPPGPFNETLGRDASSSDTDNGSDWCEQTTSLGSQNTDCSGSPPTDSLIYLPLIFKQS